MCGRYVLSTWSDVVDLLGIELGRPDWFQERFNIAPTSVEPALVRRAEGAPLDVDPMRWGLIPSWAKDVKFGARCINARTESAHEKPSFRSAFRRRRCVIPATGFFEWKRAGRARDPFYVRSVEERPLLFAGLWESWTDPAAEADGAEPARIQSFAILTRDAVGPLAEIHDRMPVCLGPEMVGPWTDPSLDHSDGVRELMDELPPAELRLHAVARTVNRVGTEGRELLEPLGRPGGESQPELFG